MARKDLCGLQAFEWNAADQLTAETQAGVKQLDQRRQEEQSRHMRLRIQLHDEANADMAAYRDTLIRNVLEGARKWHRRPHVTNIHLACDVLGYDWNQAKALCARLNINPKGTDL